MGYLFENIEKMDIQAERRNTAEARKQAAEAEMRLEEVRKQEQESRRKWQEAEATKEECEYKSYIAACKGFNCSREEAAKRLAAQYAEKLGDDVSGALEKVELYWNEI